MNAIDLAGAHRRPLGIPPIYILDQLQRGRTPSQILHAAPSVLQEYRGACGYAFAWGQLIEEQVLGQTCWRVMPVELWEGLERVRVGSALHIADLTSLLHTVVRATFHSHLPRELLLTGCQAGSRISPHSLFTLMSVTEAGTDTARAWIRRRLLPELIHDVLARCESHLVTLLNKPLRDGAVDSGLASSSALGAIA
jgi:hypothetical protein